MVKPIKIGILLQASSDWMGGIIYIQNLVKAISSLPLETREAIELYLFINPDLEEKYYENIGNIVKEIYRLNFFKFNYFNRILWYLGKKISWLRDKRLVQLLQKKGIDFIYPVLGDLSISWNFSCSWSAWIPDFQHKYLPQMFSDKEIKIRDASFDRIAKYAPNVVFSSQTALEDFNRFYPYSKCQKHVLNFRSIPEKEWFVSNTSPDEIQRKYNLPDSFFLVSNQFWSHKNHKIIIEALRKLKDKNIKTTVVCTGKLYDYRFPTYGDEIVNLVDKYSLKEQLIVLGLIPRFDQIQLMRKSLAVIQPSLFEGWSTVVEDARLLGKVILLSNISVHREQNPPKALFFDPESEEALANILEFVLLNSNQVPDFIAESEAKKQNDLEVKVYGKKFLDLVKNSLNFS